MIQQLDQALKTLLTADLAHLSQLSISFDTPDSEFKPTGAAVNLFLYDVRENRDLRDTAWRVERDDHGSARRFAPPVRVDCAYLVTAWSSDTVNEHFILGEVMQVLLRHPQLPESVLPDLLKQPGCPLPTSSLQAGRLQSMAEFWQALGGKPKAALNFVVTLAVAVTPFTPETVVSLVETVDTRLNQLVDT